jgi:hypothetical protein
MGDEVKAVCEHGHHHALELAVGVFGRRAVFGRQQLGFDVEVGVGLCAGKADDLVFRQAGGELQQHREGGVAGGEVVSSAADAIAVVGGVGVGEVDGDDVEGHAGGDLLAGLGLCGRELRDGTGG